MTIASPAALPAPKVTTIGPCHICGSGSCAIWRHAAVDSEGVVDGDALHVAHGIVHDPEAVPLVPMVEKPTVTYQKHKGRVAPLPMRQKGRR